MEQLGTLSNASAIFAGVMCLLFVADVIVIILFEHPWRKP